MSPPAAAGGSKGEEAEQPSVHIHGASQRALHSAHSMWPGLVCRQLAQSVPSQPSASRELTAVAAYRKVSRLTRPRSTGRSWSISLKRCAACSSDLLRSACNCKGGTAAQLLLKPFAATASSAA